MDSTLSQRVIKRAIESEIDFEIPLLFHYSNFLFYEGYLYMYLNLQEIAQSRRGFLKLSALLGVGAALPIKSHAAIERFVPRDLMSSSPIQILKLSEFDGSDFNGDDINFPHDVLWDLDGYIAKVGGIPYPTEKRKVVVVGGGMSGLLCAYQLKKFNPVVLEQDKHFGGNSKGEIYDDAKYSIGAAYICIPDEGSSVEAFLKEIKLLKEFKHEESGEVRYAFQKKAMSDFWKGSSDPSRASEFVAVEKELRRIYDEAYPDIPWTSETMMKKEEYDYLDSITFMEWLKLRFGNVHPHILEYFQLYCWSSFNGSIEELSATQVLNFVCSEVDGVIALPGGNAAICERIIEVLDKKLTPSSLRASAFVLKVSNMSNGTVWVTYKDSLGVIKTIECDSCVVSSPKFVAKKIVHGLPKEQYDLMNRILYRGYIVANAIYEKPLQSISYDLFCHEGRFPEMPNVKRQGDRVFTDLIFGTWAQNDYSKNGIITVYKPLPFDGARQFLFSPMAHEGNKAPIVKEIEKFAQGLGINEKMKGIRLTRWGHSLPIASKGLLASGYLEKMNRPVGKIFFANQDNYANPAFETAFTAAEEVRNLIDNIL